ncbi:unnamed protein product [Alternaria alternata]
MAGFIWPGASPSNAPTASASSALGSPSTTATTTSTASDGGAFFSSDVPAPAAPTSTALDSGTFYSSSISVLTSTASDGGTFFSSDILASATGPMVVTSTAPDPGIFYSSDVFTLTSTASDGGVFFSSDTPTSTVDSHPSTHCLPTAHLDNPLNPNVAPPIDAVPSFVDYSTPPITLSEVAQLAFDRRTPFEMPNLMSLGKDMPTGLSSVLTKRAVPRIASNPGPILGVVVIVLGIVLALFLSVKYCLRRSSGPHDLEKGNYPYTRGRRRYRDGSPPVTRPDDIPISEGYGMDPVDLARAQNWQDGFSEKGVHVTRDCVDRAISADNFQSIPISGGGNGGAYVSPQLPSSIPTRKLVPKPRPVTQLPVPSSDLRPLDIIDQPVSPLSSDDGQIDHNRTRDYNNVSPLNSPTMRRGPFGWL